VTDHLGGKNFLRSLWSCDRIRERLGFTPVPLVLRYFDPTLDLLTPVPGRYIPQVRTRFGVYQVLAPLEGPKVARMHLPHRAFTVSPSPHLAWASAALFGGYITSTSLSTAPFHLSAKRIPTIEHEATKFLRLHLQFDFEPSSSQLRKRSVTDSIVAQPSRDPAKV
jgi:hypothetical protein